MISWCFLALSLFWSRWLCMKLLGTDMSMAGMSSPFLLNHLSTMWCLVLWFFKSDACQVLDILIVAGLCILEMVVSCPFVMVVLWFWLSLTYLVGLTFPLISPDISLLLMSSVLGTNGWLLTHWKSVVGCSVFDLSLAKCSLLNGSVFSAVGVIDGWLVIAWWNFGFWFEGITSCASLLFFFLSFCYKKSNGPITLPYQLLNCVMVWVKIAYGNRWIM